MSTTIDQRELRDRTADLMRLVAEGESFEITVDGVLVAELRSITSARKFVRLEEIRAVKWEHIDADSFFADLDEIVDQGL